MTQTRTHSIIEAITNVMVGYAINIGGQAVIFPLFGFHARLHEHALIGLCFTGISIARSYGLRRAFNWWTDRRQQ